MKSNDAVTAMFVWLGCMLLAANSKIILKRLAPNVGSSDRKHFSVLKFETLCHCSFPKEAVTGRSGDFVSGKAAKCHVRLHLVRPCSFWPQHHCLLSGSKLLPAQLRH
jgi:hypothetical protein